MHYAFEHLEYFNILIEGHRKKIVILFSYDM